MSPGSTDREADARSHSSVRAARSRRLTLGQALFAVLAAFLLAQLFGKLVSDVASATLGVPVAGSPPSGPVTPHAPAPRLAVEVVVPSMLASELALIGVALVAPLLRSLSLREALGLYPHAPRVFIAAAVGTIMLGPLGDALMTALSSRFPEWTLNVLPALHELGSRLPLLVLWPTFALLPGIGEELLFRGVLQRSVAHARVAVLVSGVLFALFHVDPVHVIGVLPLGLFLAWVAQRTSTLVTIFAHVMNNTVAVIAMQSPTLDVGYGTANPLPASWLAASLGVFAVAAWVIARHAPQPR